MRSPESISSRLAVLVLCLVLVTSLVPSVAVADSGSTEAVIDSNELSTADVEIDDDTLERDTTIDVVVRLEKAALSDGADDTDTEEQLEDHAAETQAPLLEYASETPGIGVQESFWVTNAVVLEVDTTRVGLEGVEAVPGVEAIHQNFELPAPEPPASDETIDTPPERQTTDGIDQLGVPAVWDEYETRGEGVRVAVLDTGVDASHPDIELYSDDPSDPTHPGGWAAFDEDGERIEGSTPHDAGIHGTHVSGTIAGGNASGTTIGAAPDAELLHGQVLTDDGGTFAQIVAGLEWALEADADVVNLSLGTTGTYPELIDPVRHVIDSDVVVVAAIGNEGAETSGSPANVYDAISVGAVDGNGDVASFSGGDRLERSAWETAPDSWPESYVVPTVAAPGVDIKSAVPGGYARQPGTSMATPHVAGTVALLRSIAPDASPDELSTALTESAWKPDGESLEQDTRYGHGIVDAEATAETLVESRTDTPSTAANETSANSQSGSDSLGSTDAVLLGGLVAGVVVAFAVLGRRRGVRKN